MSRPQKKIVIFGTGDIGQLAHFYFTHDTSRQVVAFTGDADRIDCSTRCGLPAVPFEQVERLYPPDDFEMFVALSYSKLNQVRAQKYHAAKDKGYTFEQGPGGVLTVTATWDGGTFVISGSQELETPRGNFAITLNELRTLSANGQTLVIESTRGAARCERAMTLVYRKTT